MNNNEEMLELLKQIYEEQKKSNRRLDGLEKEQSLLNTYVMGIAHNVKQQETDIYKLREEFKEGYSKLEQSVSKLEQNYSTLEQSVSKLEQNYSTLETEVSSLDAKITDTRGRVILIENDHGKRLGVLQDGYQQLYEISCDIRNRLANTEEGQEIHDLRIKKIDTALKKLG